MSIAEIDILQYGRFNNVREWADSSTSRVLRRMPKECEFEVK